MIKVGNKIRNSRQGYFRYRKLTTAFLLMFIIMASGTVGYVLIEDISTFEAFYMTVITITTVGFGEVDGVGYHSRPLTVALIFSGFGLISYTLFAISQMVVEGEIQRMLGRRKLDKKIASLKNHTIICGFGRIGNVIAGFMKEYGYPYVIVEQNEDAIERLEAGNHLYLIGDATQDEILEQVGIQKAKGLVAATSADAQNVFIVLTAREMNPQLSIHSRVYSEAAESRLLRAGADKVIFPDKIGGLQMAMGMMRPTFTHFMEVMSKSYSEGEIALDEVKVSSGCEVEGKSLMESQIRQLYNLIVLAIRDKHGKFHFNPDKDTVIEAGSTLIAIGLRSDLQKFEQKLTK